MRKRFIKLLTLFTLLASMGNAQTLSVPEVKVDKGKDAEVKVNISGASAMTALQLNVTLPEGLTLKQNSGNYGITLGSASKKHTLSVSKLNSGELLVVLYNMDLTTFADGELLTIPVKASNSVGTTSGTLTKVRMATTDAVSHPCADVSITSIVQEPNVAETNISLNETKATLTEGETLTLVATVSPNNATDKTVTWTTSDAKVATVTDGVVKAVAAGTATITAKAGDHNATCTITVKKRYEGIKSISELSNNKRYFIVQPHHSKGEPTAWAVATGGNELQSNFDLNITADQTDNRQRFAFVTNDEGTTYYLYHAAEKKFVNKDGSLGEKPLNAVQFKEGAYDNTFVVYFDNSHYINVGGSQQMIIDSWFTPDGGNSCVIVPAAAFDPREALSQFVPVGIETLTEEINANAVVYDLSGRRVTNTQHLKQGVYIINGKKVFVK